MTKRDKIIKLYKGGLAFLNIRATEKCHNAIPDTNAKSGICTRRQSG
jgi:hypothetical protein